MTFFACIRTPRVTRPNLCMRCTYFFDSQEDRGDSREGLGGCLGFMYGLSRAPTFSVSAAVDSLLLC